MNVFNRVPPSMNPQELSAMVWMGPIASQLDENLTNYYVPPPVATVMEDITQQAHAMDMNPAALNSLISEYGGHVTTIPTPAGLATIPSGAAEHLALTNQELFNLQQQQQQQQHQLLQQQLALGGYGFLDQNGTLTAAAAVAAAAATVAGGPATLGGPGQNTIGVGDLQLVNDSGPTGKIAAMNGMSTNDVAIAAGIGPITIGDDDGVCDTSEGMDGVADGEPGAHDQTISSFDPYGQMIDTSGGSDYLSCATGQENLLHYKLMNEAQLLQAQGHFLDYDVSHDDGSNSNSSSTDGGQNNNNPDGSPSMMADDGLALDQKPRPRSIRPSHDDHEPLPPYTRMYAVQAERYANKKIKPVRRPGLVLKTPIAYKGDIDPSVIPIEPDGMAICEKCGAIGVKHSFYTKQRRFCSMSCSRSFESLRVFSTHLRPGSGNKTPLADDGNRPTASVALGGEGIDDGILAVPPDQLIDDPSASTGHELEDSKHSLLLQQQAQVQTVGYRFKMADHRGAGAAPPVLLQPTPGSIVSNSSNSNSHDGSASLSSVNSSNSGARMMGTVGDASTHEIVPQEEIPQLSRGSRLPSPCPQDDRINSIRRKPNEFHNSYDWTQALMDGKLFAAPVTCFRHAPGYDMWPNVVIGMKVEVENTDCDVVQQPVLGGTPHSFWVATVLRICGYKALLRYEGFEASDASKDFWVNLCSAEVHPVGWCATRGKPLIPPKSITKPYPDWKEFLVKRLSNARTLPSTFYNKISDSFRSRFRVGLNLEVVDKNRISAVKVATITKIVGKRLYVRYYNSSDDNGFWCHEDSPLIHPVGWASTVGHNLDAPVEYMERMNAARDQILEPNEDDAMMDLFKTNFQFEEYCYDGRQTGFEENMKLEAVDPLNLSSICVATVMSVLKFGYIMIRIDSYDPDVNCTDWFCYHEKSPCIFPVGFCAKHNITLTPPKGYDLTTFTWDQYLLDTGSKPATEDIFHQEPIRQRFKVGMKLESADLMDPRLICVATISRVVGRLLKVHFDGWDDEYDQWLDSESPDIYPIGWCVLVGHKLEGPRILPKIPLVQKISPKTTKKGTKRVKKKLKTEPAPVPPQDDCKLRAQPAPTTRTARIKKEQEHFEQQKLLSNAQLEYGSSPLAPSHHFAPDALSHPHRGLSTPTQAAAAIATPSSLRAIIKHEPNHRDTSSSSSLLSGTNALGPIFDHSTGGSLDGDRDDVDMRTEDEDGESSSATGLPSTAPSSEIADNELEKVIPRLIHHDMLAVNSSSSPDSMAAGATGGHSNSNGSSSTSAGLLGSFGIGGGSSQITPDNWEVKDVAMFLTINDCAVHTEQFVQNRIDGRRLLELSKDDIITLLSLKVGPALKIYDLIQQLKCKIDPAKSRHLAKGAGKKFL
ncbi:polycomb protein Sfmbt [Anopheles cruzii]|uniref:polycomb protein Sfmbt n=1 Tax=Anopheles cruzii TaxID=68878 RepID=UPI0022EC6846|nr:polycomb protein Sfmbt [Anopheles cruzii]